MRDRIVKKNSNRLKERVILPEQGWACGKQEKRNGKNHARSDNDVMDDIRAISSHRREPTSDVEARLRQRRDALVLELTLVLY